METAVIENANLPGSPNAFAFAEAAIKYIMRPDVTLGPMAFGALGIVTTLNEETTNVIVAITTHNAIGERKVKLHPVTFTGAVIVKSNPGARGVKLGAHK